MIHSVLYATLTCHSVLDSLVKTHCSKRIRSFEVFDFFALNLCSSYIRAKVQDKSQIRCAPQNRHRGHLQLTFLQMFYELYNNEEIYIAFIFSFVV